MPSNLLSLGKGNSLYGKCILNEEKEGPKVGTASSMAERNTTQVFQGCSNELQTLGNKTQKIRQHSEKQFIGNNKSQLRYLLRRQENTSVLSVRDWQNSSCIYCLSLLGKMPLDESFT